MLPSVILQALQMATIAPNDNSVYEVRPWSEQPAQEAYYNNQVRRSIDQGLKNMEIREIADWIESGSIPDDVKARLEEGTKDAIVKLLSDLKRKKAETNDKGLYHPSAEERSVPLRFMRIYK